MKNLLLFVYVAVDFATFIYLVFFDGTRYTWWNWIFIVPIDFFLAQIWPIYWLIVKPLFG